MSSIEPPGPSAIPQPPPPDPSHVSGNSGKSHVWGNMTFTPKQWQMFMKVLEQNVTLEIKKENAQWKRNNQRMRRMWSGG